MFTFFVKIKIKTFEHSYHVNGQFGARAYLCAQKQKSKAAQGCEKCITNLIYKRSCLCSFKGQLRVYIN